MGHTLNTLSNKKPPFLLEEAGRMCLSYLNFIIFYKQSGCFLPVVTAVAFH